MLITFKSKAWPEVLMYQEHAQRILDLLHKNITRGVITVAEAGPALATLENEVALSRQHPDHDPEHDTHTLEEDEGETVGQPQARVTFAARAYPFMEMLRAAIEDKHDIMWGV